MSKEENAKNLNGNTAYVGPANDNYYSGHTGTEKSDGLHRGLKPRHISLIAIGGAIGTGLFVGAGSSLKNGGPLGLWLGFSFVGFFIFCMMIGLGEMASFLPITGGQMAYAGRFFDPALGFAMTWSTTVHWAITLPAELSAVAVLVNYWIPSEQINNAVWIAIAAVVVIFLNMTTSRIYGETEFIFSGIKVITITGLIILGICINCGAGPQGRYIGFEYWRNPGPFSQYLGIEGSKGRFLGFWAVMTQAAFSYGGVEFFAITAAESANPRFAIPRSMKQIYFRILFFYILGTFILGLNVPSNNPRLGSGSDAAASPWVIAIDLAGIKALPSIINAALITSAWSAGNADLYTSSRALYNMAHKGLVPKIFLKTHRYGAPWVAVLTTGSFAALAFMTVSTNASTVFGWFTNLVAVMGLCEWMGICLAYIGFRRGIKAQNIDRTKFAYYNRFALPGAWAALIAFGVIIFFSGWNVFHDTSPFDRATFITNYLPAIWFPALYFGYKLYRRTKLVDPYEMDFVSNVAEVEATIIDMPKPHGIGGWLKYHLL